MRKLSFLLRYKFRNPFRKILKQYVHYKQGYLKKNGILPYTYKDESYTVHYHKGGTGPVLLFIHGFALDAMMNWADVMVPLSKHFTVIAPDLLWFGKSESNQPAVLESQRIAVERLLHELNVNKIDVIGQSYGGFVAIDLVLKNPGLVDKICLANCPGTTFDESSWEPLFNKYKVNEVSDLFITEDPLLLKRLIRVVSYKNTYFPDFVITALHHLYSEKNHAQWLSLMHTLPNEKEKVGPLEALKGHTVIMLWGEEDELFPLKEGAHFAGLIDAKMIIMPKTGHAPQMDNLSLFTENIKRFFLEN